MAIVRVSFFSNQLHRTVPFTAVLPNDGEAYPGQVPDFVTGKMKTLYLLHGYTGDENDYLSNSLVRELSAKYKIAAGGYLYRRSVHGRLRGHAQRPGLSRHLL